MIFRTEIESIVNAIIDERLRAIAESLDSRAYIDRDHGGSLEHATAAVYEEIAQVLRGDVEESHIYNLGERAKAAELERLHKEMTK